VKGNGANSMGACVPHKATIERMHIEFFLCDYYFVDFYFLKSFVDFYFFNCFLRNALEKWRTSFVFSSIPMACNVGN
jgi:hypothetical protein